MLRKLYYNKDDSITFEPKDLKEEWVEYSFIEPVYESTQEFQGDRQIIFILETNYKSLKDLVRVVPRPILMFPWFTKHPALYLVEPYLYEALRANKEAITLGIPLCYLVGFFDRSIEYNLIRKYGYETALKKLQWSYHKSEQCEACFKKHLCPGVPYNYYKQFYAKRKLASWEGVIDLYPLFE